VALYKFGFSGHKQFEHLTCTIEGELAGNVCCGDIGDEQYGIEGEALLVVTILTKVPLGELL